MSDSEVTQKLKVFISYSRADLAFADQLDAALKLTGFEPILDRHGISGGEDWRQRLGGLISEADTIIFVLSPDSAKSEICGWEVSKGDKLAKRLIPVLCCPLGETPPPERLRDLNYIFFYEEANSPGSGFGHGLTRLVEALNTDLDWLRAHTRYVARAAEWDRGQRAENRLLSGDDIETAKAWLADRPRTAPDVQPLVRDFLIAAEQTQEAHKNSEAQRLRQMESALAKQVEAQGLAEQATAEKVLATRKTIRRTRIGMAASLLFAVAAGGAGFWALSEKNKAEVAELSAISAAKRAQVEKLKATKAAEFAEVEKQKAISAKIISLEAKKKAVAAGEEAKKAQKDTERQRRFYALPQIARETNWTGLADKVDVRIVYFRDEKWLRETKNPGEQTCPVVQFDFFKTKETILIDPVKPPAEQLTHCDGVNIQISNKSDKTIDLTAIYLEVSRVLTPIEYSEGARLAPGGVRNITLIIVTWDFYKKIKMSTGREKMVIIAAASDLEKSGRRTFEYIVGKKLALTRGNTGPKTGSLEDLLRYEILEGKSNLADTKNIADPLRSTRLSTIDDAVMKTYFWDVVSPCVILKNCKGTSEQ